MKRFKDKQMAKYIRSDSFLTVGANVSEKSMTGTCEKPCTTSLALNLATDPSGWYLTLKTYFDPIVFQSGGSSSYSHA